MDIASIEPGTVFKADGVWAVKTQYGLPVGVCECILLESGEIAYFSQRNDTPVEAVADIALLLAAQARVEADYAMLRAIARRCFAEDSTDQDMLNLWNLAASEGHPGAALIIRFNRAKAVVAAARVVADNVYANGSVRTPMMPLIEALEAYDAPLDVAARDGRAGT